jgi:hypothetical protein
MIITLIILGYVLSVFLNRWANKVMYQKYDYSIDVILWFTPLFGSIILFGHLIYSQDKSNWFTGKNW